MPGVVVLGVFVADAAFRADRMPRMGETTLGRSFQLGPGGKGSNQAVAAAKLGVETHMMAHLGADDFAQLAQNTWDEAGVIAHVTTKADSYTGAAFIYVDAQSGDNAIIIAPGAAALISPADVETHSDLIASADVFVTQLEQPIDAAQRALEIARANGVTTLLNPAPAAELPEDMLALCDYITPNETECEAITGLEVKTEAQAALAAERLKSMGVGRPIITMGEKGAFLDGHGLVPAISAGPVVETTGAGDAFNGAFAAALVEGKSPEDAVAFGCACAGLSVTKPGAAASMPSRADVDAVFRR